jgi:hypothetical protein
MRLALIQPTALASWDVGEVARVTACTRAEHGPLSFEIVESPGKADLVVLMESCSRKTQRDLHDYRAFVLQHGADRLVCMNYEDKPPGFLPGLYSSLESFRFDEQLHRSWPHLRLPNTLADEGPMAPSHEDERLLFSFAGACSHPLRRLLFDSYEGRPGRHRVVEIKRWYDHRDDEKQSYVHDISRSKFVLCPRGIASYSHRIVETLALGRVPVVIADDWVPFSIPDNCYCLRIPERSICDLEERLTAEEDRYDALSQQARKVYALWFSRDVRYRIALQQLCYLHVELAGKLTSGDLHERWSSQAFRRSNGWALDQRIQRRFKRLLRRRL